MASPFPGMNPYLEHPDRWSTVHKYDRSGYRYFIDYSENPLPPLATAELDWLEGLLKEQELR